MVKIFELPELGYSVEIGKVANQADGAVFLKHGGTVVVVTAVSAPMEQFIGFFPLSVEYREQFAAAGKIPGGYFKREGRLSDREVLTARLIDRAIRPLFPKDYFDQVQILATVYSVDKEHAPQPLASIGASLALAISQIPFMGPIGTVQVARINGEWVVSPTYPETLESDVTLIVSGTNEGICMVEGSANEISDEALVDALFKAHAMIKEQIAWQEKIIAEVGKPKVTEWSRLDWAKWEERAQEFLAEDKVKSVCLEDKLERDKVKDELRKAFIETNKEELESSGDSESFVLHVFHAVLVEKLTKVVTDSGKRVDGRDPSDIRAINVEVGLLPFTHGSALFSRGRTQALVTTTLGGGQDEQRVEYLMGDVIEQSFMLHYNFPPFSVGEVRPVRGPGRREVGHGFLAASAFKYLLPLKERFPYTIRVVSDILESDGSSSMATVCGATMSLMSAGVPIRKMVAGIAMGLLKAEGSDKFMILSDICGMEDAFGLMDFKVAGTDDGITAIQMDIKYKGGLKREVFVEALKKAGKARAFVLGKMREVMDSPSPTVSELVPKVVVFKISTDKIGSVIGPGGKIIKEIVAKTGATVDIENDGTVRVFGKPEADMATAVSWVKLLGGDVEIGSTHKGKITRVADFGLFIEIVPGKEGLLHISGIPPAKKNNLSANYHIGDEVEVRIKDYDDDTGRIRLRFVDGN